MSAAASASQPRRIGSISNDKVRLILEHCDPTVNLYDRYVCIR
jgi:D-serine deaminase-like pyridoxal phosphate-dependent protein